MRIQFVFMIKLLFILALMSFGLNAVAQNDDSWEDDSNWETNDDNYDPWADAHEEEGDMGKTEAEKYRESIENACENKYEYRTKAKSELYPYTYSSGKTSIIHLKRKPYFKSLVVPIYFDYQHSIVFNRQGMNEKVAIRVFDGPQNDDKRQLLFEAGKDEQISTFELASDYEKSKVFIEYLIPPSHPEKRDIVQKGCIVFVMGYLDEAAEDFKSSTADNK